MKTSKATSSMHEWINHHKYDIQTICSILLQNPSLSNLNYTGTWSKTHTTNFITETVFFIVLFFSLFIKKHTLTHCNRSSCLTWNKLFVQFGQLFLSWTYRQLSLAGLTLASIIISLSLLLLSLCSHRMACFILHRHHNGAPKGGPEGATATLIQSLPPTTTCTPRKVQCICFLKMLTVTVLVYAHRIINNPCYFL